MIYKIALAFSLAGLSLPAKADSLSAGKKAAAQGDYQKAFLKWAESSKREAFHLIGAYASLGKIPNCDANCALGWYQRAVDNDYVPSLTGIASLYYNDGQTEKGLAVFNFAARWNDESARSLLASFGQPVPNPDLWNAHVERQQLAITQAKEQQALNNQALAAMLAAGVGVWSNVQQGRAAAAIAREQRGAQLLSESYFGGKGQCEYYTQDGKVTVTVSAGQSCPKIYGGR